MAAENGNSFLHYFIIMFSLCFHFHLVQSPSNIFQSCFADIIKGVEGKLDRALDEFLTAKLIPQEVYDDITSIDKSAYKKASKAVRELQRGISNSSDPEKRLKETCDVLKKLNDELLNKTVAKIMGDEKMANGTGTFE